MRILNTKRTFLLIFLGLLGGGLAFAQTNTPKFSNEFLAIGVGARAQGMGKAMVANVSSGDAGYWNPAGLVAMGQPFQVNLMHAEWFAGIAKYDYVSFAKLLGKDEKSAFGVSVIRLGTDDIPYTFNLIGADGSVNYDDITGFSAADYGGLLSYSRDLSDRVPGLRLGGSAKVVYRTAGRFATAWGFGLDLGVQYERNGWLFGLMGRDITSTFNAWNFGFTEEELGILQVTGNELQGNSVEITLPRFIAGVGYKKRFSEEKIGFLAELDMDFTTDGQRNVLFSTPSFNMDPSFGLEMDYKKFVFIRGGIHNFQRTKDVDNNKQLSVQPNLGLGVKVARFNINYAFSNAGGVSDVLYSHIVSVTINLSQGKDKQLILVNYQPNPVKGIRKEAIQIILSRLIDWQDSSDQYLSMSRSLYLKLSK